MAIYHLSGSIISRSQGRSAIAGAAYRSGEKLHDQSLGLSYDYTKKQDVVYSEILLPEYAPQSFKNRETLWNSVEQFEKRKDAQLAREFNISLPRELTIEQNKALITEFVRQEFVSKGMIADVCIHNDLMKDGSRQPHAHVMLTLREVSEKGFGPKVRSWNDKELLLQWRESWANNTNYHLALNGFDVQIDHRSNEARGIELEPQYKIGPIAAKDLMARYEDHQRIARENGELIFEHPELALEAITKEQSTFTHRDIARFVSRHTEKETQFNQVFEKVKSSKELVFLGLDAKGQKRFSTQAMIDLEASMMRHADRAHHRLNHEVSFEAVQNTKAIRTLSQEQETALDYLTSKGDLKSLVGYAGTGKSYLLGAAREAWENSGYRVQGAALSGIAALNLKDSSSIASRTIASLFYHLDKGTLHLDARDILVVDEAGMLGTRTMERLVREVDASGAKLVLMGDWQQLQAIEAGAPFRALAKTHQYAELNQIRRQTTPWQVQASLDLALGHVDKALDAYQQHDQVHRFKYHQEAKEQLISQWNDVRIANPNESQIILAYTRNDVKELNELAREQKRKDGELGNDVILSMERGQRAFAVNDRVYFLKREDSLSVINGTLGTICSINEKTGVIGVELDRDDLTKKSLLVSVDAAQYRHLEHGYAATVYKAQGVTVDRSYILPSKHYDAHSTYVAMTRHRKSCDLFVSHEAFANDKILVDTLGRNRAKDLSLDYTQMNREFARFRGVMNQHKVSQDLGFMVEPLEREQKEKLEEFTRKAISSMDLRKPMTQENRVCPDVLEFKRQFESNNPELAKKLRYEIGIAPKQELLTPNKDEVVHKESSALKQKGRERELELER
ncbi:TPA: Ti-type conjugative transfer relaxase TraA [Legionella pneumophila]|nr:Ti-type conjugative transfer relaxase TraA [Legionella pneumophila]HAU1500695.1 Ti-type conjugative transfer relaxase TraA [Legionella pneumophila]HAU1519539.1 Ti-type conjugative transfer relaxase TraA [Legionella pneumophila]